MTTQLPERLRDLADDAPASLSADGLWREGRRRQRRRVVAGAVAAAVLVALSAGLGVGDWRSRQVEPSAPPATGSGPMSIPDRLWNPSPWTPSTRTPGRLVALGSATRDHFPFGSERNAMVGVAAGSQAYRFVGLPDRSPDATDAYLAPDGLHVAYWVAEPGPGIAPHSVSGLAVLDVVSGAVQRYEVSTPHGLSAGTIGWVDDHTLAMTADRFTSADPTSYDGRTHAYLVDLSRPHAYTRMPGLVQDEEPVAYDGGYAAMVGARVLRTWPRTTDAAVDVRLSVPLRTLVYDGGRALVAGTRGHGIGSSPQPAPLMVGRVTNGLATMHAVPGRGRYEDVLTWTDSSHVTATRLTRHGVVYDLVDVRTGSRQQITSKPWYSFEVAADALQHPTTVPGIEPARPWNPRWVAGAVLAILVVAVVVVWGARRSRVRG